MLASLLPVLLHRVFSIAARTFAIRSYLDYDMVMIYRNSSRIRVDVRVNTRLIKELVKELVKAPVVVKMQNKSL